MRYLVALGLVAAIAAPMGVWSLAESVDRQHADVLVSHGGVIRAELDCQTAARTASCELEAFCRSPATIEPSSQSWNERFLDKKLSGPMASRIHQQALDEEGKAWRVEAIGGDGMPTLLFVSTESPEGPGILTNKLAEALAKL